MMHSIKAKADLWPSPTMCNYSIIQYFCSKCGVLLKETSLTIQRYIIKEDCPSCGLPLDSTMRVNVKPPSSDTRDKIGDVLIPKFYRAFDMNSKLTFGIDGLDSLINLRIGENMCLVGGCHNIDYMLARLCIRALVSKKHDGFESPSVLFVDAGNDSDIYKCVSFARQYGLNIDKVLQSIIVSRTFTIYQLADLLIYKITAAVERFNAKVVIVSSLLKMFQDPMIDRTEGQKMVHEIVECIKKLSRDILVIISVNYPLSYYKNVIFPAFANIVEIHTKEVFCDTGKKNIHLTLYNNQKQRRISISQRQLKLINSR